MSKNDELEKEKKTCGACHKDLTISSYSKKQWQLKFSRCKECIELDNAIKQMDINDKQHSNNPKKKGGSRTKAKAKISIPSPYSIANGVSTTSERSGTQLSPLPQPSIEQIREIKKSLSDPNHLVELLVVPNEWLY